METKSMAAVMAQNPELNVGYNALPPAFRVWIDSYISPGLLIAKCAEADRDEAALIQKCGKNAVENRRAYCLIHYAVTVLITGDKLFYRNQKNPGDKYRTEPASEADKFTRALAELSWPLIHGYMALNDEEKEYIINHMTPNHVLAAFRVGEEAYEKGELKNAGRYQNINAAKIAWGVW